MKHLLHQITDSWKFIFYIQVKYLELKEKEVDCLCNNVLLFTK